MPTKPIMRKTVIRPLWLSKKIKAFTLLESLLVLMLTTSLLLVLSSQIQPIFKQVQQELFFLEFEHFYKESQQLSQGKNQNIILAFSAGEISNGYTTVTVPSAIKGPEQLDITFDASGGNHSLRQLQFVTEDKTVTYQLYLGSGKYKKTEN